MKTKIFCDSADFQTIKKYSKNSLVSGFTTNPSLMKLSGAKNYKNYSLKILRICTVCHCLLVAVVRTLKL